MKVIYFEKIVSALEVLGVSRDELLLILFERIAKKAVFKAKTFETVSYQESSYDSMWITMHIRFDPVIYEKAQDMRRNYKFSVSWLLAYGIIHFLDEIISEMTGSEDSGRETDNSDENYFTFSDIFGDVRSFMSFWGVPEDEHLKKFIFNNPKMKR